MDNKELTRLFAVSGNKYGFTDVTAEFAAFRDFKIKWTRSYNWASFEVSDYLSDAPEDIIRPLADTIFKRINGDKSPYALELREWLTGPGFIEKKRPLYLRRLEKFVPDPYGKKKDLKASLERLEAKGLTEHDPALVLGWGNPNVCRAVGASSVIMKVVMMSTALDQDYVSDEVLDYSLYALLTKISMGLNTGSDDRAEVFEELMDRYPERNRMEMELRLLRLHI